MNKIQKNKPFSCDCTIPEHFEFGKIAIYKEVVLVAFRHLPHWAFDLANLQWHRPASVFVLEKKVDCYEMH